VAHFVAGAFEHEPGRGSAAKLLSKDEARRIAVNIAKPPVNIDQTAKSKSNAG
jgi:hypothetical protein